MDTQKTENVSIKTMEAMQNKASLLGSTRNSGEMGRVYCILEKEVLATGQYSTNKQSPRTSLLAKGRAGKTC